MSPVVCLSAISCLALGASLLAGQQEARPLRIEGSEAETLEAVIRGPQFHAPQGFHDFEEFTSPLLQRLRKEYALDEVVRGEASEFRKMLKLRHWVHSRWHIDNDQKFSGDVFQILEKAKTGAGFYCTHSMRVQHAVMTAMGFVARDLGVDSDHLQFGRSNHHGVNEVWSNDYAKWVLLDAKYDVHYERAGVPLSALELHEAARADRRKNVVKVQGPDRQAVPMKGLEYPTSSVLSYWWVSYTPGLRTFTGKSSDSGLVVFDNEAFRKAKWFRQNDEGLVEHWAYRANAFRPTRDRHQIDWSVGVPDLEIRQVARAELDAALASVTPNLAAYRIRIDNGSWQDVAGSRWHWKIHQGENTLDVRTRNFFGVEGPIVTATV